MSAVVTTITAHEDEVRVDVKTEEVFDDGSEPRLVADDSFVDTDAMEVMILLLVLKRLSVKRYEESLAASDS